MAVEPLAVGLARYVESVLDLLLLDLLLRDRPDELMEIPDESDA